ncbi:Isoflavone reductase [Pseudocercospora fuligena]|uniref:Isoflavone reductase n=1 Tax=Pseudocercospora fuligena TaxID=685502 RepID=A0A8H6VFC9_9PEZI|nr:Isoflavone reductase [Pseudocercospora fuligena]
MAEQPLSIAVFGATGVLGSSIVNAFLEPHVRKHFGRLIAFSRDEHKLIEHWRPESGIFLRRYSLGNLQDSIVDIDIVINAVNTSNIHFHTNLVKAMATMKSTKAYFPSEFGIDGSTLDFRHESFERSKSLSQLARNSLHNTKVCQVFPGIFLENVLGPWLGLIDTTSNDGMRLISVGSKHTPISCTSVMDIGRSVAQLCLLPPSHIPDIIHLAGTTNSMVQMADIIARERRDQMKVVELSLSDYKASVLVSSPSNEAEYLKFVIGEGKVNHGKGGLWNGNELVNPRESSWKWKTFEDMVKENDERLWKSE